MCAKVDDFYYHGLASYNDRKRWYDMGCEAAIPLTEEDQVRIINLIDAHQNDRSNNKKHAFDLFLLFE